MKGSSLLAPIAKRLEGKVALITGGASGIGESSARLFARHGAKVVIADVNDRLGRSFADDINLDLPDAVSYVRCDVTSDKDVENAVNDAILRHGRLDVMFSNAGIGGGPDPAIASVTRVFDVNVYGALLCVEMGPHGVRVNCVSPYLVATPLLTSALGGDRAVKGMIGDAANLKGAAMRADDVAEAALYLGSDESRYVSGLNLVVDGGYSTTNVALGQSMSRFFGST